MVYSKEGLRRCGSRNRDQFISRPKGQITRQVAQEAAVFENYRRYKRFSVSAKAVIKRWSEGSPEGLNARVTTISQGGMGFYTDVLMEKATPVSVELFLCSLEGMTKNEMLQGRIASICTQGSDYFVGIAFDREISYDRFVEIIG
jgi:hypothetical protein